MEKNASAVCGGWSRTFHPDVDRIGSGVTSWVSMSIFRPILPTSSTHGVEDHSDVVLVAHSYGDGCNRRWRRLSTDASNHLPRRSSPRTSSVMLDTTDADIREALLSRVAESGTTPWLVPSNPMPPDTDAADLSGLRPEELSNHWNVYRTVPVRQLRYQRAKGLYLLLRSGPGDMFRPFAGRANHLRLGSTERSTQV